jgi:hypothetical protein
MATLALGAAGAVIGSAFGNPALGWALGTTLAGVLFPPRLPDQERGRLDDLRITTSSYGQAIPIVYGRARLGGVFIWSTNLREHIEEEEQGGKGGGSTSTLRTYTYSASFAVLVCRGTVEQIKRIWADDVLVFDADAAEPTKFDITIYSGEGRIYPTVSLTQEPDPVIEADKGVGLTPAYRGSCYVVFEDFDLSPYGNRLPSLSFEVYKADVPLIGEIVSSMLSDAGLEPGEIDTSEGVTNVTGFIVAQRTAIRDPLESLLRFFDYDLAEVDGTLKLVARGGAIAETIPAEFYGAASGSATGSGTKLTTRRIQEVELPARVDVTYFSSGKMYQQAAQGATRYTKEGAADAVTMNLPLVLTDTEARRGAERTLYRTWLERETHDIFLPPRFMFLAPGDPVEVLVEGEYKRVRLLSLGVGLFAELRATVVPDEPGILSQYVEGATLDPFSDSVIGKVPTVGFVWDGNALRDSQADTWGLYAAFSTPDIPDNDWYNFLKVCSLEMSSDGGATFKEVAKWTESAIIGETLSILPPFETTGLWDYTGTVDIEVVRGTPTSRSEADVLAGKNAVLIGDEIIQYQTATAIGVNQWRLSNLLRGRRGTEVFMRDEPHGITERVVFLTDASIKRFNINSSLVGSSLDFRFVGAFVAPGDAPISSLDVIGRNWLPYAPVDITGNWNGGNDLLLTWKRQARKDFSLTAGGDIPLGEESERYEIDIFEETGVTLLRTITGLTAQSATYTSAQQAADGLTPGADPVVVAVYQLGRIGRGYTLPALFDPIP